MLETLMDCLEKREAVYRLRRVVWKRGLSAIQGVEVAKDTPKLKSIEGSPMVVSKEDDIKQSLAI